MMAEPRAASVGATMAPIRAATQIPVPRTTPRATTVPAPMVSGSPMPSRRNGRPMSARSSRRLTRAASQNRTRANASSAIVRRPGLQVEVHDGHRTVGDHEPEDHEGDGRRDVPPLEPGREQSPDDDAGRDDDGRLDVDPVVPHHPACSGDRSTSGGRSPPDRPRAVDRRRHREPVTGPFWCRRPSPSLIVDRFGPATPAAGSGVGPGRAAADPGERTCKVRGERDRSPWPDAQHRAPHRRPADHRARGGLGGPGRRPGRVDPRSAYVERFWLPILGPSCTWLVRRLADRLDEHPAGVDIELEATARSLGLGGAVGRHAPFLRAIERGIRYGLLRRNGPGELALRRRVGPLPQRLVGRLPPALQDDHDRWPRPLDAVSLTAARRQARRLAVALRVPGRPPSQTEDRLLAAGVHPSLAHEAAVWAEGAERAGAEADGPGVVHRLVPERA